MSEIDRIKDQLRRSFEGEAWHGPAVLEVLENVSAKQAAARPLTAAHSIWEIVLHITATQGLVLRRLEGDNTPLTPAEDWPPQNETGEGPWRSALTSLQRSYSELYQALSHLGDDELDKPILSGHSSLYVTLHGLIQHNLYHAGQVAVLTKG